MKRCVQFGLVRAIRIPIWRQRCPCTHSMASRMMSSSSGKGGPLSLDAKLRMMRYLDTVMNKESTEARGNLPEDDLLAHMQFRNNRTVGFDEFLMADKNGDGRVSSAEWEAFLAKKAMVDSGLDYKSPDALNIEVPLSISALQALAAEQDGLHVSINGMRYRLTLSPEGKTRDIILAKEKQLGEVLDELAELEVEKRPLDMQSARHTKRVLTFGLMYLVSQAAVIAKLTFFSRFGWDVMEPITYFITFGTAIMGFVFFQYHKIEYSYPALAALITQRKARRLYRRKNFNYERYTELQALALKLEKQLLVLEPPTTLQPRSN